MKELAWFSVMSISMVVFVFMYRYIWVKRFEKKHSGMLLPEQIHPPLCFGLCLTVLCIPSTVNPHALQFMHQYFFVLVVSILFVMMVAFFIFKVKAPVLSEEAKGLLLEIDITFNGTGGGIYHDKFRKAAHVLRKSTEEKYYNPEIDDAIIKIAISLFEFTNQLESEEKAPLGEKAATLKTFSDFQKRFNKLYLTGTLFNPQS